MRKMIDIDDRLVAKLKILSAFEEVSVKALMEKAVSFFVEEKEKERLEKLSEEEKEDIGLFMLLQQVNNDSDEFVSEEEVMRALRNE